MNIILKLFYGVTITVLLVSCGENDKTTDVVTDETSSDNVNLDTTTK